MAEVLVLRALGLGDLLTAVPALRALRRAFADDRLILATSSWLRPLVEHLGVVDEQLDLEGWDPAAGGCPATAVNLHGRGPQSHRWLLASDPGELIAFRHPDVRESDRGPAWPEDHHEVSRWCRLLTAYGIAADPADLCIDVEPDSVANGSSTIVIHPGAKDGARRWPPERWASVVRACRHRGLNPILTGSSDERILAEQIATSAGLDGDSVIAGDTDVWQLARVVAAARLVLSGDTGIAHLAVALGRPSLTIFGPTSPKIWGPPDDPHHAVIWAGLSGDPHGQAPFAGLLAIWPANVTQRLDEMLVRTA